MAFFRMPSGNAYHISRIAGARAVEEAFLALGNAEEGLLEYDEAPTDVAVAWRDAAVEVLTSYRPNRPLRQVDWWGIAAKIDPGFARANGWRPEGEAAPQAEKVEAAPPRLKPAGDGGKG